MYDYIIVGAGVAGSRLARNLEEYGMDYLLIEASKNPGIKDSGIVSERVFQLYDGLPIKAEVDGMLIRGREAERFVEIPNGIFVLKREKFGKQIRKGLNISYDRINHISGNGKVFVLEGRERYEARYLVGADGTASIVRNSFNIKPPEFLPGMFTFSKPGNGIEVFFDKSLSKHFFAWRSLDEYGIADKSLQGFEEFLEREGARPSKIYSGLIPIKPIKPSYGRLFLLGDAAGMTKPITGGGIIYSTMAADLLAELFRKGRENEFAGRWFGMVWKEQMVGYFFRKIYPLLPQKAVDMIVSILDGSRFDYDFLTTFVVEVIKKWFKRLG